MCLTVSCALQSEGEQPEKVEKIERMKCWMQQFLIFPHQKVCGWSFFVRPMLKGNTKTPEHQQFGGFLTFKGESSGSDLSTGRTPVWLFWPTRSGLTCQFRTIIALWKHVMKQHASEVRKAPQLFLHSSPRGRKSLKTSHSSFLPCNHQLQGILGVKTWTSLLRWTFSSWFELCWSKLHSE